MNDPEIIRKLEEIERELSGIKREVERLPISIADHFGCIFLGIVLGGALLFGLIELVDWLGLF